MWLSLILSCWGAIKVLKPQPTKNKVGSSLSWLPPPPPPLWCCLLRPLFIVLKPALSSFSVFSTLPLVAKTWKASSEDSQLPNCTGSGPSWLGRCSGYTSVPSGLMRKERWRAFFFSSIFEEGESGTPASSEMAGILIAKDTHFPPAGCQADTFEDLQGTRIPRRSEQASFLPWHWPRRGGQWACCFALHGPCPSIASARHW